MILVLELRVSYEWQPEIYPNQCLKKSFKDHLIEVE